jgi:stearoyl-CoA desaturase (Delta-9 desaturase)
MSIRDYNSMISHIWTLLLILVVLSILIATAIYNIWIFIFFVLHWYISVFFQSFFHHRYAAHAMFVMKKWWERFFHFLSWLVHGSSYLVPSAYAVLHRLHHKYSDTDKDPHSPLFFTDVWSMMNQTANIYSDILRKKIHVGVFSDNYPSWDLLDRWGNSWVNRIIWLLVYCSIYYLLGAEVWMYLLIPIHALMSPIHGAIVNRAGHMVGYVNHHTWDNSKNTLPIDFLTVGELFQNNHHHNWSRPKFSTKWWEFDPTYSFLKLFAWMKIIRFSWK